MSEPSPPESTRMKLPTGGHESLIGKHFNHYEITAFLGEGGMGTVFLARDTKLGRNVALKLLPSDFTTNPDRLRRFQQEASSASALNHPNILTIYEISDTQAIHFIATEFIEGETLRERMTGGMKIGEVLTLAEQVASALAAAHEAGIVHRDIKPENIMVRRRDGIAKVLDFGLAKLTSSQQESVDNEAATRFKTDPGIILGTVNYMSPEQARGRQIDARTDIFSLGVVTYEMLAGRLPFEGATPSEMLGAVISDKEPPPLARFARDVPRELEHIVSKALRKDPEQRYQTVKDMLIDLRDVRRDLELQAQLERSASPETNQSSANEVRGLTGVASQRPLGTKPDTPAQATSTGLSIVNQAKHHRRALGVALAALAIAAAATLFWYFKYVRATPALTDKDTILLADFINTTGDTAFDGTLKSALAMQLEQSPFLNLFSDERVRQTLRLMNRSPDDRVTKEVAREICQRQGLKAYLSPSISNLGSHYVVTLEAINALSGDILARQQAEAESKEKVLSTLGQASTKLREQLGESLASLQKYDAPIEQVTTSSLEALKAYSLGRKLHLQGKEPEAIPLLKRAIELDPNFARAYDALSYAYENLGETDLARQASTRAFEHRDRASEYEKLKAESHYFSLVSGELEKAIETLKLLTHTYPRDYNAHNSLASLYNQTGRYESAIEEAREAIRLDPNINFGYSNLATAFIRLNRFDEAKQIYEQAMALKFDRTVYHTGLYSIAFVQGDHHTMQKQLEWASGRPNVDAPLFWQGDSAGFLGQLNRARELYQRGAETELSRGQKDNAASTWSLSALRSAAVGNCRQAREEGQRSLAISRTWISSVGLALALCGETGEAQAAADEASKQLPKDTLENAVRLPIVRAAIELRRSNPAAAIQLLQSAKVYDRIGSYRAYWPEYLRGQAYLAQSAGAEAAVEFQKIIDRRGLMPTSVLYPLAYVGLARAAALQGDSAGARKLYQDFFAMWKDADADIPILLEARSEYEKLE